MIVNALALKLTREAKGDFRGLHFPATLTVQAVSWYLRCALPEKGRDASMRFREQKG